MFIITDAVSVRFLLSLSQILNEAEVKRMLINVNVQQSLVTAWFCLDFRTKFIRKYQSQVQTKIRTEVEELSEQEFTEHPLRAGISTFWGFAPQCFPVFHGYLGLKKT